MQHRGPGRRRRLPSLAPLIFALSASLVTPPLAAGIHDAAELETAFRQTRVMDHREALETARDDAASLRRTLRAVDDDPALSTPMRERLLVEGLRGMATAERDDRGRALLEELSGREPQSFVTMEDVGRELPVPYANVGAEARRVLARWDGLDARDDAMTRIIAGREGALSVFGSDTGTHLQERRAGVMEALQQASEAQLAGLRSEALDGVRVSPTAARPALYLAVRLGDPRLAETAVRHGAASQLVHDLPGAAAGLATTLGAEEASRLLMLARERAEIADVAHAGLAGLAHRRPANLDPLFDALGDPDRGAGAAAALARRTDPSLHGMVVARLAALAGKGDVDGSDAARSRALLALHLMDAPEARRRLISFAQDEDQPDALRATVRRWLR